MSTEVPTRGLLHGPPTLTPIAETRDSQIASSHPDSASAFKLKWNADKLELDVVNELSSDVFCDVAGFLENMFPVSDKLVNKVVVNASKSQCYDGSKKRWSGYPTKQPNHESDLCEAKTNGVQWRDYHSTRPLSRDRYAPDIKPDIVATIGVADDEQVPWSRVLVPAKIKKHVRAGPALLQPLMCMRMVFRESMDRCFVVGIVIACTNMSVYLADRTGVLGSVVFNINEEPRLLIRVIVGLCVSSLADLGWDTSMSVIRRQQLYSRNALRRRTRELSYTVPWNPEREDHYWVIDMPKPKQGAEYGVMDEKETETFVLYQGLNLERGEAIRGRATRIWKAWLTEDLVLPQEERRSTEEQSDDDDCGDTEPAHTFHHDLESILYILLWNCMCRAGPAMRRTELWSGQNKELADEYTTLFQAESNFNLGRMKQMVIKDKAVFNSFLRLIADYYRPLKPLLRRLWSILHKGYKRRNFDDEKTYKAFIDTFEKAERTLLATPEIRTPEQEVAFNKEENRREADRRDWERTPSKRSTTLEVDEAEDRPPVEGSARLAGETDVAGSDVKQDPSPSPAPRGHNA